MNDIGQIRRTYDVGRTARNQGWTGAVRDIFAFEPDGALSVAWRFLKAPVETILTLANNDTYTGYWKFMLACMGAHLTLVFVLLPRIGELFFHLPAANRGAESFTIQGLQLTGFPILTMVQYYLCRALGTIPHPPRTYAKLCALSVGYGWVLTMVTSLVEAALIVVFAAAGAMADPGMADRAQVYTVMAASLVFIAISHRKFWGMTWPRTIAITLALSVLSWAVVYPGLAAAASRLNVTERLKVILN